jgi:hypothetical protein
LNHIRCPNVSKTGGLQSQDVKSEAANLLPQILDPADGGTGSEVLRLSCRVNNMAKSIPSFDYTDGDILKFVILL